MAWFNSRGSFTETKEIVRTTIEKLWKGERTLLETPYERTYQMIPQSKTKKDRPLIVRANTESEPDSYRVIAYPRIEDHELFARSSFILAPGGPSDEFLGAIGVTKIRMFKTVQALIDEENIRLEESRTTRGDRFWLENSVLIQYIQGCFVIGQPNELNPKKAGELKL